MVKGSIQEEDITIINIYAPNIGAPRYLQQILTDIKGEIDGNTIIVGDFNTPLTSMERSSRQKINKATEILNATIEKLDLIDILRTLHKKKIRIYIFLKCTWNILKDWPHTGHKANLNKFKSTEIISSIFSDHNDVKLEINHRKRNEEKLTTWRLNNILLKKQWVNEEIKKEIKKHHETNNNEDITIQNLYNAPKVCSGGKWEQYRPCSKKKKNLKLTT